MAIRKWDLLTMEQQTAGLVPELKAQYWGWFDMVNGILRVTGDDSKAFAMTIPEGIEHGAELERWTAWKFPDGRVRAVRPQVLAIFDVTVGFPEHLACGCLPHEDGLDWFLVRESDKAMANISRSLESIVGLSSLALQ